jgi:hypothetical protein
MVREYEPSPVVKLCAEGSATVGLVEVFQQIPLIVPAPPLVTSPPPVAEVCPMLDTVDVVTDTSSTGSGAALAS